MGYWGGICSDKVAQCSYSPTGDVKHSEYKNGIQMVQEWITVHICWPSAELGSSKLCVCAVSVHLHRSIATHSYRRTPH
jgi:hypothetical protein